MLRYKRFASLFLFLAGIECLAANSIEDFETSLINALERRDLHAFESLIHPRSIELARAKDPKAHIGKMERVLEQKAPSEYDSHKTVVIDIETDDDYDSLENSIRLFGKKRAIFPAVLEKRLTIFVKEGDLQKDGEWTTPLMAQVLSRFEGRWYMVWPSEIK